jgi:putative polyketide hydroxylase
VHAENQPQGAHVELREIASGSTRLVEAGYLVACHGAHSTVRRALEIEMRGTSRLAEAVSALSRAPL